MRGCLGRNRTVVAEPPPLGPAGERYQRAGGLPLIVTCTGSAREQDTASARLAAVVDEAAEGRTVLESINVEALTVTDEETAALWAAVTGATGEEAFSLAAAPGIAAIVLDGVVEKSLAESAATPPPRPARSPSGCPSACRAQRRPTRRR
ncbi:hypothetical protein SAMN05444716_102127 [Streptomyces harbinensis]|uniref:Uncharacterized protein n=1 Tax=Streptomyces harbinensis TaxID=1176198 RepID=A0A1I6QMW7_9ACTN|nr:hypothetical protein SAMN05444716_102127 [Streptomyces harbinensis]